MAKGTPRDRQEKREHFQQVGANKPGIKPWLIILSAAAVFVLSATPFLLNRAGKDTTAPPPVKIEMTGVTTSVSNGKISVPIRALENGALISFQYDNATTLPLLAYTGPSGKTIAAVSFCEPCKSDKFHIENGNLVCNACGTVWALENHKGISGGCQEYPPEILPSIIQGGQLLIDETAAKAWKPRV